MKTKTSSSKKKLSKSEHKDTLCLQYSEDECEECVKNSQITSNGICKCKPGFIFDSKINECNCPSQYYFDKTTGLCVLCHYSCKTCTGSESNQCTLCTGENHFLNSIPGKCICADGFYSDVIFYGICSKCHWSCGSCSGFGETKCSSCTIPDTKYDELLESCGCKDGFYLDETSLKCQGINLITVLNYSLLQLIEFWINETFKLNYNYLKQI